MKDENEIVEEAIVMVDAYLKLSATNRITTLDTLYNNLSNPPY